MSFEIHAVKRTTQGSGASRRLRHAAKVPAILYGGNTDPILLELDHNEIFLALCKEAFHSSIITLHIDQSKQPVLLRDHQMHPYKRLVMHIDFQRVNPKEKLHIKVPLHFINVDNAPGIKQSGGTVNHIINEIEVTCLPADLPGYIDVDMQNLEIGQSIHASEIKLPKGVTLVVHGSEDPVITTIISMKSAASHETPEGVDTESGEAASA